MNIICHCWLNKNDILLGLNTGFICIINMHGNILQRYDVFNQSDINYEKQICLLPFSRGVFISTK